MSPLGKRLCVLLVTGFALASRPWTLPPSALGGRDMDLANLYTAAGGLVRDTNGDAIADAVATRVVLPASPSTQDVESAANIAARLGYETTALTLPLVVHDSETEQIRGIERPVLIGRANTVVKGLESAGLFKPPALQPGQGLLAVVPLAEGGRDAVVVTGADDDGTRAAATELAARLPRLWTTTGATIAGLAEQARSYLTSKGVTVSRVTVPSLVVDANRLGLASVTVVVEVTVPAARAVDALGELDRAHATGLEPRTLNFANVEAVRIDVIGSGRSHGNATVHRSGMSPRLLTPPIDPGELAPDSPGQRGRAAEAAAVPAKRVDLANAYSIDGWFGDSYADLIPDRSETVLVLGEGEESLGSTHIAARLGLESTGVTLPIAKAAAAVRAPELEPNPILIGGSNPFVQQLVRIGRARLDDLGPGDGVIEMVPRAFGGGTATIVAGNDRDGTNAAAMYLGRRVPYIWETAPGAPSFIDLTGETLRFFQAKSPAGQASQALDRIDAILGELRGKALESLEARLFIDGADPKLNGYLTGLLSRAFPGSTVSVATQATTDAAPVLDEQIDIPWEVDDLWSRFRTDVLPRVHAGSKVDLDALLSESPEVRRQIEARARAELTRAGASEVTVRVLSAYKPGFLWITEQVIPALRGRNVKALRIKAALHHPRLTEKYKFHTEPTRWLHELFPVDEVVHRELGIPSESVVLQLVDAAASTYEVEAIDGAGKPVMRAEFSPRVVEREYLDKFPGWSRVEVETGWLTAKVDGQIATDARIETDPERFWDYYQQSVLPKIYDHVMKVTDGRPTPDKQPFHRDLNVEVWMSEPDFRIGIDEEQVSSLESLHEDLYFVTLDFFDAMGRTTTRRRLAAPGSILPIMHAERAGQAGHARVLYADNVAPRPRIDVVYKEKGSARTARISRDVGRIEAGPVVAERGVVRSTGVRGLEVATEVGDDSQVLRAVGAIDALERLHAAGLYLSALSYAHADRIIVAIDSKDTRVRRSLNNTGTAAESNVRHAEAKPASPLVVWDHVISPDESEDIVGRLTAYPEVKAYRAGVSYRGRPISVMEVTLPTASELVSRAKLTTLKPTIFITARQHANEMSSTGCALRLTELLATDPLYTAILKKVNVIVQPVENVDGAQTSWELQKLTPNHMLHAGRYTSLGIDVGSQVDQTDPLLPEALVRGRMWRTWLPDIYLNLHGYPSHEWVQRFAGYVPPNFKSDWIPRGFHTTVRGNRDPRNPSDATALAAIREAIVREVNSNADAHEMNVRYQARYRRWAFGFAPFVYNQEIYRDTAIYYTDQESGESLGNRRAGTSPFSGAAATGRTMNAWPQVTFFSAVSETPDETAQGRRVELVTRPVFSYVMANIKYLRDGQYAVQRIEEDYTRDAVSLTTLRVRPVLPGSAKSTNQVSD
jgi:murein tripeptide amidase MpaA